MSTLINCYPERTNDGPMHGLSLSTRTRRSADDFYCNRGRKSTIFDMTNKYKHTQFRAAKEVSVLVDRSVSLLVVGCRQTGVRNRPPSKGCSSKASKSECSWFVLLSRVHRSGVDGGGQGIGLESRGLSEKC